jgi:hypothetical protein
MFMTERREAVVDQFARPPAGAHSPDRITAPFFLSTNRIAWKGYINHFTNIENRLSAAPEVQSIGSKSQYPRVVLP